MAFLLWHGLRDSVRRHPDRVAVEWRAERLTYAELDARSDAVAARLRAAGIGPGHRVGMYALKTHRSIIAMLGISKSGAAYVPIDPHAPTARTAFILGDCAVSAVFASADRLEALHEHREALPALRLAILMDEAEAPRGSSWLDVTRLTALPDAEGPQGVAATETDPAYLLYTSGSTGKPKGVIITHRNALTFIDWGVETFAVRTEDRLSSHAPLHFDLSVFDIYAALFAGACVVLVPDQVAPFPGHLAKWIREREISIWYSVPSALVRMLLHGDLAGRDYPSLRILLFAGEVFPQKYLREVMRALPHTAFYNLYGPTEPNVCTWYALPRELDPESTAIPIGVACANTEVFAVGTDGQIVADGEEGELLVRGGTVMAGYWGLPERTAQSLVKNQLQTAFDDEVYRTGDIVRRGADGNYWFVGRRDHMVKSRGYRIELGEVEAALHAHPAVREAVVIPVADDEVGARLRAVLAPNEQGAPSAEELHAFCMRRLPPYMVPESFLLLPELPKTSTGKTDRQALHTTLTANAEPS